MPVLFCFREDSSESRIRVALENDRIDSKYGFERVRDVKERTGYLINMHTVCTNDLFERHVFLGPSNNQGSFS